jgi:hypothetical protein
VNDHAVERIDARTGQLGRTEPTTARGAAVHAKILEALGHTTKIIQLETKGRPKR